MIGKQAVDGSTMLLVFLFAVDTYLSQFLFFSFQPTLSLLLLVPHKLSAYLDNKYKPLLPLLCPCSKAQEEKGHNLKQTKQNRTKQNNQKHPAKTACFICEFKNLIKIAYWLPLTVNDLQKTTTVVRMFLKLNPDSVDELGVSAHDCQVCQDVLAKAIQRLCLCKGI